METSVTDQDLTAAVACFDEGKFIDFRKHWAGQPDVPITLIRYAAKVGCNPKDKSLADELGKLNAVTADSWSGRLSRLLQVQGQAVDVSLIEQAALLVRAQVATVSFVCRYVSDGKVVTPAATESLYDAAQLWHDAWPLSTEPVPPANTFTSSTSPGSSSSILLQFMRSLGASTSIDCCTFLILQRLLNVLLRQPATRATFRNDLKMLLVRKAVGIERGEVRAVSFLRVQETGFGFYPDPVAFGATPMDGDMLSSLRVAWAATQHSIGKNRVDSEHFQSGPVVRLQPRFQTLDASLIGDSAGTLCACGLYGTATGQSLDGNVTVSCSLNASEETVSDLSSVPVGAVDRLVPKIQEASNPIHGLRRVVVLKEQFAKQLSDLRFGIAVGKASSLADVYRQLVGDTAKSEILRRWCCQQVRNWENALIDPHDKDNLVRFIPPTFSLLKAGKAPVDTSGRLSHFAKQEQGDEKSDPYQLVPGEGADHFINLLKSSQHLCITEDAGAGKSVASRRLTAFVSSPEGYNALFDGHPCLAIRYEESEEIWPSDITADLRDLVGPFVEEWNQTTSGDPQTVDDVVRWSLTNSRVFLVLDGLDQVIDGKRLTSIRQFLHRDGRHARVLLTGRSNTMSGGGESQQDNLLTGTSWRFGRINEFSLRDQYQYLEDVLPSDHQGLLLQPADGTQLTSRLKAALNTRLPDYNLIKDLLATPIILRIVRDVLVDNHEARFISRGDLYAQASRMTIRRAGKKLADQFEWKKERDVDLLEQIQAAVAFQMAVEARWGYSVKGTDLVRRLRLAAAERCGLNDFLDRDWNLFLAATHCTNRSIFDATKDDLICFRHRGFMEFYAALHLVRNQQPGWRVTKGSNVAPNRVTCGDADLQRRTNDPEWYWIWRFATEIPPDLCDPAIQLASLSELFRQPHQEIRPTELIYRSWHLFELDDRLLKQRQFRLNDGRIVYGQDLPVEANDRESKEKLRKQLRLELGTKLLLPKAHIVLREFRSTNAALLHEFGRHTKAWNRVPLKNSPEHASFLQEWQLQSGHVKSHTFLQCPPESWVLHDPNSVVGVMGGDRYNNEKPQHQIRVKSYLMQATTVTQAQYALFDSAFATSHRKAKWGGEIGQTIKKYCRSSSAHGLDNALNGAYPLMAVDFYDAWVFSKWLGSRYGLPSECQQEFGIRAGSSTSYCFGDNEVDLSNHGWYRNNSDQQVHRVGLKCSSDFGHVDLHGNVWEWSHDWYDESWYSARQTHDDGICREDDGPACGSFRVLRGGAWGSFADDCRSAGRLSDEPDRRSSGIGFRLVVRVE